MAHHCIVTLHLEHLHVAHSVLGAPEDVGLAHHHVMGIHHRTWLCSKPWLLVVEHLCSLSLHFVVEAVVVVMPSDPRLLSLVPSSQEGLHVVHVHHHNAVPHSLVHQLNSCPACRLPRKSPGDSISLRLHHVHGLEQ